MEWVELSSSVIVLSSWRLGGDIKSDNEGSPISHSEMTTKNQNRKVKNHPECRPAEIEVTLRLAELRDKIFFSTFQTEETETEAVGAAGELASKISKNFLSISAIKKNVVKNNENNVNFCCEL